MSEESEIPTRSATGGAENAPALAGCAKWAGLTLMGVALIAGLVAWKFIEQTAGMAQGVGDFFHRLADTLHTRSVEENFRESITRVVSTKGDILELATVETEETFTRADSRSFFGDMVYLGTTVSEIRVPVVYRYHLKLSDDWKIEIRDGECRVLSPVPRPSLPPAIRTDGMEKKSASGWLRFNAAENLAELEKGLTPRLEQRAGDKRHLDMAREACRKSAGQFVRKWMLESHPDIANLRVMVTFPDEIDATLNVLPEEAVKP